MRVGELQSIADHGLLGTVRDLCRNRSAPPTTEAVAAAVGVPAPYSDVIAQRLELNEERGLVKRDDDGRWLLTDAGELVAVSAA
jgi:Mn-dependent DtxR family transcriptional regulator